MAQLSQFVDRLGSGGARANQFSVQVTGGAASLPEGFTFLCRSAQIPAQTIGEVAVPYRGRQVFLAGDRTFDAWTTTVFSDDAWGIRSALESWSNAIQDMGNTTNGLVFPSGYYGTAIVKQLSRDDVTLNRYDLFDIWPQTVDAIDLAYDTNDAIMEFGVTWRFNYMKSEGGGGAA